MSDISAAPAESSVVIDPSIVAPPNPIDIDNVDHEAEQKTDKPVKAEPKAKDEPAKKPSTREALLAAREKMDKAEIEDKAKTKPEDKAALKTAKPSDEKAAKERDETGKFKPKEAADDAVKTAGAAAKPDAEPGKEPGKSDQSSHDDQAARLPADDKKRHYDEAPARFSPEAKAAWKDVPEHARAETHRMLREYETGIEEHRKRWEPVKQYDDMAKQYGTTLPAALERYVAFDRDLNEDLLGGVDRIIRDKTDGKFGLKDLAAEVAGQKPEESQSRSDATIHKLEQTVSHLVKQVEGLGGHVQKSVMSDIDAHVSQFAKDKPWFDALGPQIAAHIKAGLSLEDAAEKAHNEAMEQAKALGFAEPAAPQTAAQTGRTVDETVAQTDAGKKSISGAPGVGTIATVKKQSGSIRDSIRKAAREAAGD